MSIADLVTGAVPIDVVALNAVIIASSVTLLFIRHYQESLRKHRESEQKNLEEESEDIKNTWSKFHYELDKMMEEWAIKEGGDVKESVQKVRGKASQLQQILEEGSLRLLRRNSSLERYGGEINTWDMKVTNFLAVFLLLSVVFGLIGYVPHPGAALLNLKLISGAMLLFSPFLAACILWGVLKVIKSLISFIKLSGYYLFSKPRESQKIQEIGAKMTNFIPIASVILFFVQILILQLLESTPPKEPLVPSNTIFINIFFSVCIIIVCILKILVFHFINNDWSGYVTAYRKSLSSLKERLESAITVLKADADKAIGKHGANTA